MCGDSFTNIIMISESITVTKSSYHIYFTISTSGTVLVTPLPWSILSLDNHRRSVSFISFIYHAQ